MSTRLLFGTYIISIGAMGNSLHFFSKKDHRVLMMGLDGAGKTTFLYKIKLPASEIVTTIPTIGNLYSYNL